METRLGILHSSLVFYFHSKTLTINEIRNRSKHHQQFYSFDIDECENREMYNKK